MSKRIGILTSGGDCPGLNAIIRAVVKCSSQKGWDVYGIPYGTQGFLRLANGNCHSQDFELREHCYDLPGLLHGIDILQFLSGSILGSLSKGTSGDQAIADTIIRGYQDLKLDALIAVGGDGSLDIIYDLAQQGRWNIVAIPKTIDNDVPFTERSVGFDTAVDKVTSALYDLTFTAASHDRTIIIEVMGRNAGHLALSSGIAGGADVILIPELVPKIDEDLITNICLRIAQLRQSGRKFALVVIAEGVRNHAGERQKAIAEYLTTQINETSQKLSFTEKLEFCDLHKIETRSLILGHIQRSGTPSSYDRLLAATFAKKAADLIAEENYNQLVVWQNGEVQIQSLDKVVSHIKKRHQLGICPNPVDANGFLVQTAGSLGIYLGENPIPH
ncbi:6-phosphofructokinase [Xenococcus sp. PCC 7305]|uniref:ATP-dependent 6-phosphofructokinase n=1 Tax=Xenococcus sp. PCC 7305 TaxID=102125 RepID=UPI0002AC3A19|nr:ATP-dependent 6-phosphofructokinase [Xenococcus sp. PCC 7305]ELS00785.1 6-phosphofructokinase [Xenococcus sp. PCC 7305]